MKSENLNTKLATHLSEEYNYLKKKIVNIKSRTFQITTFILLLIGILLSLFYYYPKKQETIKPIIF